MVSIVLRDVKGAFDKVWHDGLRYKLGSIQLENYLQRILSSYLSDRKGYVIYKGERSEDFNVTAGVPQGSRISPTLYNIYIHDSPETPPAVKNIIYADDITQIITSREGKEVHKNKIIREVERLNTYEKKWKIKTNLNKFKIIHLDRRHHHDIVLNNRIFATSGEGVILGLKITKTGYATHVTEKRNFCRAEMGKLWRLKDLGWKRKRTIYQALISSRLHYPPIPLHCLSESSLKSLQRIQNQGARYITGTSRIEGRTNEEVNRRANLDPLNQSLFIRAAKIWNKVRVEMREEWREVLTNRVARKRGFPLSIPTVMNGLPPPIYG